MFALHNVLSKYHSDLITGFEVVTIIICKACDEKYGKCSDENNEKVFSDKKLPNIGKTQGYSFYSFLLIR